MRFTLIGEVYNTSGNSIRILYTETHFCKQCYTLQSYHTSASISYSTCTFFQTIKQIHRSIKKPLFPQFVLTCSIC